MSNQETDIDTLINNIINNSQNNNFEDKSNQILLDEADNEYVYQFLINIFCKLLIKVHGINFESNNDYSKNFSKINSFNLEKTSLIKKYFRTIGFNLDIEFFFNLDEYDLMTNNYYQNRYCKILYKANPNNIGNFNFFISCNFVNKYKETHISNSENNLDNYDIVNNYKLLNNFKGCYVNELDNGLFNIFVISFSYL